MLSLGRFTESTTSEAWSIEGEKIFDRGPKASPRKVCAVSLAWGSLTYVTTLQLKPTIVHGFLQIAEGFRFWDEPWEHGQKSKCSREKIQSHRPAVMFDLAHLWKKIHRRSVNSRVDGRFWQIRTFFRRKWTKVEIVRHLHGIVQIARGSFEG